MSSAALSAPLGGLGRRQRSAVPGFGLTLGVTLAYLGLLVLIPLAALAFKAAQIGVVQFVATLAEPRVLAAFRVSLLAAFLAALVNAAIGLLVAWVLVRYRFPGRRVLDGLVDLPFALPTAVAGIALEIGEHRLHGADDEGQADEEQRNEDAARGEGDVDA